MDAARLIEGHKSIMRAIYSPGEYCQRALDCLERVVAGAPEARRNGFASDVAPLFRVRLALGVRDRARGEFWRYLRHALTGHREKFGEAMRLEAVINFKRVPIFLGRGSDPVILARRFNVGRTSVTGASRVSDG